jgi:non-ribosomal peptide synthetase component F
MAAATPTAHFDVMLSLNDAGETFAGRIEYASDLFDSQTAERLAAQWHQVVEAMVADDAQALARVPLLDAAARRRLLVDFNNAPRTYHDGQTIPALVQAQARRHPGRTALVQGDVALSFGELDVRAERLAGYLQQSLGVRAGDVVAVCMPRSPAMVKSLLAVMKAGAAYLMLDATFPAARLSFILRESRARLLIADGPTPFPLEGHDDVQVLDLREAAQAIAQGPARPQGAPTLATPACCIYTSGSTGQPKGVVLPHETLLGMVLDIDCVDWASPSNVILQHSSHVVGRADARTVARADARRPLRPARRAQAGARGHPPPRPGARRQPAVAHGGVLQHRHRRRRRLPLRRAPGDDRAPTRSRAAMSCACSSAFRTCTS